jgi:hypothetical protein
VIEIFLSDLSVKNPIQWPSGDMKGVTAPGIGKQPRVELGQRAYREL